MLGAAGMAGSRQLEGLGAVLGNLLLRVRCDIANRVAEVARGERGATAVEYGLLIVFIAAVVLVMVRHLGLDTRAGFRRAGIGW